MKNRIWKTVFGATVAIMTVSAFSANAYAQSARCQNYATNYADQNTHGANNVGGGAVAGAIIGGIIGAQSGNWGKGAAIGAGVGATGGAIRSTARWRDLYNAAYRDCMYNSHANNANISPSRTAGMQPWTDEWYAYCSAKYRSFDPRTGTFQPYNGPRKLCR